MGLYPSKIGPCLPDVGLCNRTGMDSLEAEMRECLQEGDVYPGEVNRSEVKR